MNDSGALGRIVDDVPDPEKPGEMLGRDTLECNPMQSEDPVDEGFRPVAISSGDSISVALGTNGTVRAWGSFDVRPSYSLIPAYSEFLYLRRRM